MQRAIRDATHENRQSFVFRRDDVEIERSRRDSEAEPEERSVLAHRGSDLICL